jgi:hypothetical protein
MRNIIGMLDGTFTLPSTNQHFTHDSGGFANCVAHIIVSAISGAGASATFLLEDSPDGVNWSTIATSSAITATGTYALRSGTAMPVGQYVRVRLSAFAGTTPSLTCATKAHLV